jgi:hypothetical protein
VAATALLSLALWVVVPQATHRRPEAMAGSSSPGYVVMIHATAEPHSDQVVDDARTGNVAFDQAKSGFTNANGAVMATRTDGSITFRAIPYRADTVSPVVVSHPRLEIETVGRDRRLVVEPNVPAGGNLCRIETSWAGHEGPLEACTVFRLPVTAFDGMDVVTLTLHFVDAAGPQQRVHNAMAHVLLHAAIGGAPIDLKAVDTATTEATPLVIQNLIETKSM